mgnify:CR=1 FL=1
MKDLNTTVSFNEWTTLANTQELATRFGTKHMNRVDAMEFLNESTAVAGYLTSGEGTVTRRAKSLDEIKQYFDECTNSIFPYTISHQIPRTAVVTMADSTARNELNAIIPDEWVVQYAEVETV